MKKLNRLTIRVSDDEKEFLKKLSLRTGKNTSACVRQMIDSHLTNDMVQFESKEDFLLRKKLIYEISKIGTNINQIAHNANMDFYTIDDKKNLIRLLNEVKYILKEKL